jgi:hypothetical protein
LPNIVVAENLNTLRGLCHGDIEFNSQSLADQHWIVAFLDDNGPRGEKRDHRGKTISEQG